MNKQYNNKTIRYIGYAVIFSIMAFLIPIGIITGAIQDKIGNQASFVYFGCGIILGLLIVKLTPVGGFIRNNVLLWTVVAIAIILILAIISIASIGFSAQAGLSTLGN